MITFANTHHAVQHTEISVNTHHAVQHTEISGSSRDSHCFSSNNYYKGDDFLNECGAL